MVGDRKQPGLEQLNGSTLDRNFEMFEICLLLMKRSGIRAFLSFVLTLRKKDWRRSFF